MTGPRHHSRPLWFALLAIVGMVSVADVASACSERPAPAAKVCCTAHSVPDCSCCPAAELPAAGSVARSGSLPSLAAPARAELARTAPSCECRSNAPAAPARDSKPRSTSEDRTDPGPGQLLPSLSSSARPPAAPVAPTSANASPPKSPLYLRTSRLLI